MMRRLLFLMPILLCAVVAAHAQSLDAFKQRLAEPTPGATLFNRAQVTVTEHGDAARAAADAARAGQRLYFEGFHRVCVFSDNGPAARDGAFAAKALFEETYPDVKVYVVLIMRKPASSMSRTSCERYILFRDISAQWL